MLRPNLDLLAANIDSKRQRTFAPIVDYIRNHAGELTEEEWNFIRSIKRPGGQGGDHAEHLARALVFFRGLRRERPNKRDGRRAEDVAAMMHEFDLSEDEAENLLKGDASATVYELARLLEAENSTP